MRTLSWSALSLGSLLLIGLLASPLLFLYSLLFSGPWFLFIWTAGLSLALVVTIKLLALSALDDKRQLDVAAMLSELISGTFGWTWMAMAGASLERELVEKGLSKEEARRIWIARAREIIQQRKQPVSLGTE